MDGREADALEEDRALELLRLDALQVGLWDRAAARDVKAVNAVLRIFEQRARLLGSDKPESASADSGSVVDPAYWTGLKET